MPSSGTYRLELLGPFRLYGPDGARIEIASKKGMALVAMLAVANGGERTRSWLQDRLWGSRQQAQAQQSLRRELFNLRECLNLGAAPLLFADHDRVRIDLSQLSIDLHDRERDTDPFASGEFLEGLDIAGEDLFEDWLREQRRATAERLAGPKGAAGPAAQQLPSHILDLSQPAPGFDGRPAMAVLPFANATGLDDNAYLADGISEALIEGLSRLRWLPVIAAGTSFGFRDADLDGKAVGAAMGARYLLQGQLLAKGNGLAMSVSLTDAPTGRVIWSHRDDLPDGLSQEAIERVIRDLVSALDARVESAEHERVMHKSIDDLTVNELIWRARWHLNRLSRADAAIAKDLLDQALAANPNSAEALVQATFCMAWSVWSGRESEVRIREMRKMALRAIAADKFDARGHLLVGMAETWLRRPLRAKLSLEQAIALNPSLCPAYMQLGSALYLAGEPEAALAPMRTALRLNPHDSQIFCVLAELGMAHCMLGQYGQAIEYADLSLLRRPAYWYAHLIKINALVRTGDLGGARLAHADLQAAQPGFTPDYIDWLPFTDSAWLLFLREGLERSRPDQAHKDDSSA